MTAIPTEPKITHREFKLLLKPEKFPKRSALMDFNHLLAERRRKFGVRYEPFDSLDSQTSHRPVLRYADQELRKNSLIFRMRQILRQGGWPDDTWEITFKCRAPELETAARSTARRRIRSRRRNSRRSSPRRLPRDDDFDLLEQLHHRGPELDLEIPFGNVVEAFPHMKTLDLDLGEQALHRSRARRSSRFRRIWETCFSDTTRRRPRRSPSGRGLRRISSTRWLPNSDGPTIPSTTRKAKRPTRSPTSSSSPFN